MRRLYGFTKWLIESILQQEAVMRFSQKFKDKNVDDVPPGFWQWLLQKMEETPGWTPAIEDDSGRRMTKAQVLSLAQARSKAVSTPVKKPQVQQQPVSKPGQQPATTTPSPEKPQGGSWVLGRIIGPEAGIEYDPEWIEHHYPALPKPGTYVVATKVGNEWTLMTRKGQTVKVNNNDMKSVVQSVKGTNNKPVMDSDPEKLWKLVPAEGAEDGGEVVVKPSDVLPNAVEVEVHGRLSKAKMNEYNSEIENSFLQTNKNIVINALAGTGKAQPLDALLLTPNGWIKMGDIKIGDSVFGSDGKSHEVVGVFPQGIKEVFSVEFNDGTNVECCADHLWFTETKVNRDTCRAKEMPLFSKGKVVDTNTIINTLKYKGRPNHYVPLVKSLDFSYQKLEIDPYLMGVLLGDGCFRTGSVSYSTRDQQIVDSVNARLPLMLESKSTGHGCDYRISSGIKGRKNEIVAEIKSLGLWDKTSEDKFIPSIYKFNDINTRINVLQGLLDTDGYVEDGSNTIEYCTVSKDLANDVKFLVESLGGIVTVSKKTTQYTHKGETLKGKDAFRLFIRVPNEVIPFKLHRKLKNYKPRIKYHPSRSISSITSVGNKECQCIAINSPDSLYVTNNCVLTHNTTMLKHLASYKRPGEKWLYLVFNKKNQVEATKLDPKTNRRPFPQGVEVLTTHSFLGRVLENNARLGKIPKTALHDGKGQSPKMAELLDEGWFEEKAKNDLDIPWKKIFNLKLRVKKLASLGKSFNVNPKDSKEAMSLLDRLIDSYNIETTLSSDNELESAEKYGRELKDYRDEILEMTFDVLRRMVPNGSEDPHHNTIRDHDDTLWWAALHADELTFPHYDVVLADEVQDFNKNQQIMLKKLMEAGARIIAVGDPWQAIYRFRGADNDAFNNVEAIAHNGEGGAVTHMLPINYRSGKKIIDYANEKTHMKDLDAGKRLKAGMGHDGEVTENKSYADVIDTIKEEWDKDKSFAHPTAILARTNAPLLATAMELLRNGIPFQIVGREFLDEIMKFIKAVTGIGRNYNNYPILEFRDKMNEYVAEKQEAWKGKVKKQGELEEIVTIGESLNGVIRYLEEHNWQDPIAGGHTAPVKDAATFSDFLRKRFGGLDVQENDRDADKYEQVKDKVITITTGHRSKGLEFDRVYIIRNDLYDSPKGDNPEEIQQERNGQYVAYTRAKKQLHVINDKKPGG